MGRRVSSIRPGSRPLSLVSEQETDEDVLLGVEFDGIQSRREQPNQRFEHAFESSILTDLIFRKTPEEE